MKNAGPTATLDGSLGLYVVRGEISAARASEILAHNHRWVSTNRLPGQVVDYQGCALEVTPAGLVSSVRAIVASRPDAGLQMPTALLVAPDQMGMWRDYCWLMAQAGLMRGAFTDHESARRWVKAQAVLWTAQAAHRKRGQ